METAKKSIITVEATVNAPVEKVWKSWTEPEHIIQWNQASEDWHTTRAENDLKPGGKFSSRMEAKDGSFGFDFGGIYDDVQENRYIEYTLGDGRKVNVRFEGEGATTRISESFEAENTHSLEMQKEGWQAIMNSFKKHVESI